MKIKIIVSPRSIFATILLALAFMISSVFIGITFANSINSNPTKYVPNTINAAPANVDTTPLPTSKGGTGLTDFSVQNNITSSSTTGAFTAAQGKLLLDDYETKFSANFHKYLYGSTGNFDDYKCTGDNPVQYYAGDWSTITNGPYSNRSMGVITALCRNQDAHMTQTFHMFYNNGLQNQMWMRSARNPIDGTWSSWVRVW
jgi:hypothetical protein